MYAFKPEAVLYSKSFRIYYKLNQCTSKAVSSLQNHVTFDIWIDLFSRRFIYQL